jgi:hypothetical protein
MYAFNGDPAKGLRPDPEQAKKWWMLCLDMTDQRQVLWAQAQMGLISVGTVTRDQVGTKARCEELLALDPDKLELPRWKDWSRERPEEMKAEMDRARESLKSMQKTATERLAALAKVPARPAATASAPAKTEVPAPR